MFFVSCQKELTCYFCEQLPIANAGTDIGITLPVDSAYLSGSSDNPDVKITEWSWSKIEGPLSYTITDPTSPSTSVRNLVAGIYLFELKITDDKGVSARDTVEVNVRSRTPNKPPIADAGSDKNITLPTNTVVLDGSKSSDPDKNIIRYNWVDLSLSSTAKIANVNEPVTQVSGLTAGIYHFKLTVTDAEGLFANDTVEVKVIASTAGLNCGEINRPEINAKLIPFAKLSEPSSGMAVASAGNKIVFAGASLSGYPSSYGSSAVHIFDISTKTWSSATLSAWRADITAIASGNKIFFAGGRLGNGGNNNYFSTVDVYDVTTNTWTVEALSQSRAYIAAAAVGDKVFFAGGEREWPHPVSDRIDIYDLRSASWSTASLSLPRTGITALKDNNQIYFAGGSNQLGGVNNVTNTIDIYNNDTNKWSTDTLSEPKAFFAGINVANRIYWAGGYGRSGSPTCKVQIKDLVTRTSVNAFLFQPFSYVIQEGLNPVVKDNNIIWFATLDPLNGNSTDKFNIYNITTGTWSIGKLPYKISGASIISVNNIVYVAGGSVNGKISDQVWILEL